VLSPLGVFKFGWERNSDGGISVMGEVPFGARAELVLEDGVIEVEAGGFSYRIAGTGMKEDPARIPIGLLLAGKRTREVLLEAAPILSQCPENLLGMSIFDFQNDPNLFYSLRLVDFEAIVGKLCKSFE
jgi:hypothetical protein